MLTLLIIGQAPHYRECRVNPIHQESCSLSMEGRLGLPIGLPLVGYAFYAIQAKGAGFASPFWVCSCVDPTRGLCVNRVVMVNSSRLPDPASRADSS
jgi:hypothetical protein